MSKLSHLVLKWTYLRKKTAPSFFTGISDYRISIRVIGFVGLIVPHAVRLVTGPMHRKLMPMAAISGGIFLIACDTIARSLLADKELSVGIITSICGVPFFLWLLYKNRKVMS